MRDQVDGVQIPIDRQHRLNLAQSIFCSIDQKPLGTTWQLGRQIRKVCNSAINEVDVVGNCCHLDVPLLGF